MSDGDALRERAAAWFYAEHFGFVRPPPQAEPEVVRNMARCLLAVASGDGTVSAEERDWMLGYFAAKGYPAAIIEEARTLEHTDLAEVPALMQLGLLKASGRILLYDAIRVASADGYHPSEMRAVRTVAQALGVPDEIVDEIEQLVLEEALLREKRIALLMPGGHPSLP